MCKDGADRWACWVPQRRCDCPATDAMVVDAWLYVHLTRSPLQHGAVIGARGFLANATLGSAAVFSKGVDALRLHDGVRVDFCCRRCGVRFTRTYELGEGTGKRSRVGAYERHQDCAWHLRASSSANSLDDSQLTEATCEAAFASMPGKYNAASWNCAHFSRAFTRRALVSGSSSSGNAGRH